ncbi:MAG: hypothetical protein IPJ71_10645 [Bdellovibrionales bacterium]|nr:hypothetical protein [Bdellovibrionales bacterium]
MTFENVQFARWPGNISSPVRLLVRAGLGLSLVLATMLPLQAARGEKHHRSRTVDQQRCHGEPENGKMLRSASSIRRCRSCGLEFALETFPAKGGGRRESRCVGCHNTYRRSRSQFRSKDAVMAITVRAGHFDEKHEGLNDLLDLICSDILRKEVGS